MKFWTFNKKKNQSIWLENIVQAVLVSVNFYLQSVSSRFYPYEEIETDAVFNLDEDSLLTTDEVWRGPELDMDNVTMINTLR